MMADGMAARAIPALRGLTSMLMALAVMLSGMTAFMPSAPAGQPGHCEVMPNMASLAMAGAEAQPPGIADRPLERHHPQTAECRHCGSAAGCADLSGLPAGGGAASFGEHISLLRFNAVTLPGRPRIPPFRPPRSRPA